MVSIISANQIIFYHFVLFTCQIKRYTVKKNVVILLNYCRCHLFVPYQSYCPLVEENESPHRSFEIKKIKKIK